MSRERAAEATDARRPRIVIAPDAFKGCLSSVGVASALAAGFARALPDAAIVQRPLADGGEGTLAALAAAERGVERSRGVVGPYFEALQAGWWSPDADADGAPKPAVVEMARASGLSVTRHRRPTTASTFGTGQLIAAAAKHHSTVWLACGGSATSDGGAGALRALGYRLLDAADEPIEHGGAALVDLARIEPPEVGALADGARLVVLCDVRNPLVGPDGAAAVYGPQKGASAADVKALDAGLERFGAVCAETFGRDPRALPGAGAAGGLPAGLWAALGAELVPGFEALADRIGLDAALDGADLVVTGEGRFDGQTAQGKTISGVVERARARGLPVWAFAGEVTAEAEGWCPEGVVPWPIADGPRSLDSSVAEARRLIERAAWRAGRSWAAGRT